MTAVAAAALVAQLVASLVGPHRPAVPDRPPVAVRQVAPRPSTAALHGVGSWFAAPRATAAAGPALRVGNWRGRWVTVTANGRSVRVRLTDWCACRGRLIDLGSDSFSRLAPLSRGLVTVSVR